MENKNELNLGAETPEQIAEKKFIVIDKLGVVHHFENAASMDQFKKDELAQEN